MRKNLINMGKGRYLKKEPKIRWKQEIRVAIITSLITFVVGTFFIWNVRNMFPGEYSGTKLDEYFRQRLASELGTSNTAFNITIDRKEQAGASASLAVDTVIICGTYSAEPDQVKAGRYISIWERDESSFWNELFGTDASYSLAFLEISDQSSLPPSTLRCLGCAFDDLDDDGDDDITVGYDSKFADRVSII